MNIEIEMVSLFDYLKKPAGPELGKQVSLAAMNEKIHIESKQISTPKYKGNILMYPKTWLDEYFNKTNNEYQNISI
jgi:hypothetical protein